MKPVVQLDGALWRIVWFRAGDRLAHRIEVLDGGEFHEVLTSIEGTSDESWPLSPPLQEVHFESRPGGSQVALLVGMAGNSHWSASVEMSADGNRATFELACRAKTQPERLGSTYAVATGIVPALAAATCLIETLRLTVPGDPGATGGLSASVLSSGEALADKPPVAPGRISVRPEIRSPDWPQTVRWAYSIQRVAVDR